MVVELCDSIEGSRFVDDMLLSDSLLSLARLYGERQETSAAEQFMHRYVAIKERAPNHINSLWLDYELAAANFAKWHNDAEAERLYLLAIDDAKSQDSTGADPNVAFLLGRAAWFFISLTRYEQARSMLNDALAVLGSSGEVHGSAQIYHAKAAICRLLGDRAGALRLLDAANAALKAAPANVVIQPYTYEKLPSKPSLARREILSG